MLEPKLGVLLFVIRGFFKEGGDLVISLFACNRCKVGVFVAGL